MYSIRHNSIDSVDTSNLDHITLNCMYRSHDLKHGIGIHNRFVLAISSEIEKQH